MRVNYPGTRKRIYLDTLRNLAYNLYRAWQEGLQETFDGEKKRMEKMKEQQQKKQQELLEQIQNRSPAEEILEVFTLLYTNIAR